MINFNKTSNAKLKEQTERLILENNYLKALAENKALKWQETKSGDGYKGIYNYSVYHNS